MAVELEHALGQRMAAGSAGCTSSRILARGDGWNVADVMCTSGPRDRPFEERHASSTIAIVLAGSFQYRSHLGRGMMTPGSLMLGNRGQCFECGHEHGDGDRCVSFWYSPEFFDALAAGIRRIRSTTVRHFTVPRLPPLRGLAPLVARAAAGVSHPDE